ncbi:pyridoxal phosphate-dependent decarboxylase family protein [Nannocystis radixulma]|uniref:Aminotransferase class I/II-fold pyridoxal phosphate-dependent enzyme n=1 Tax=Nannocystis radixulma TaxID=2995305 RepID=A0ABT5AZR0_9BACT|nr:aminotransferase class I/II-fold pyridoxal phosphate-dependent enzyme [Nannocystis radixulma]MDC0666713.1 aminotransferase class I/II-fold pyridoxal phosphate-dependent enzyme [Nannocystis radixulma]
MRATPTADLPTPELEPDAAAMQALVAAAMARICEHIEALPRMPACDVAGGAALARELREQLPERGSTFEHVLEVLFDRAVPCSFNTAGPGYLAYIPGGGLFLAAVADLIADATNRYVGVWQAAPGLVQLETNAVRWLAEIVGLPAGSGGFLTTGGSLATFSAVVTARSERLGERFDDGVIYTSEQAHHSVQRAARLAGFRRDQVREVAVDEQFRVDVEALARAIAEDRARGLRPCMIVGHAGTTNTGAVDDLAALAELAARERVWLHVDAAYGGFFCLTARGRAALAGIERADSVTLDPHKGMFLPYGTGCLLARDPAALRRAHGSPADYLPPMQDDPEFVDYCELSPELSRDFRGLRVWLPLKLLGAQVFARGLDEKLDLAESCAAALRELPGVELVAPPQLSLLAFRHVPSGLADGPELDEHNRRWLAAINRRGRVYLTSTVVRGRFVLRVCVLSFRTHRDRIDAALADIRAALAEVGG